MFTDYFYITNKPSLLQIEYEDLQVPRQLLGKRSQLDDQNKLTQTPYLLNVSLCLFQSLSQIEIAKKIPKAII